MGSQGFPTQVFDVCFSSDQSKDGRLCRRILTLTAKDKTDILRDGLFHDTKAFQSKINGSAVFFVCIKRQLYIFMNDYDACACLARPCFCIFSYILGTVDLFYHAHFVCDWTTILCT